MGGGITECAKCGTRNPHGVAECLYCGASLLPPDAGPAVREVWSLIPRLAVSLVVGLLVFTISCYVAYRQYSESAVRYAQYLTRQDIERVQMAVETYWRGHHTLPRTLAELGRLEREGVRTDETGVPVDSWRRPLHYWTDRTRYRVVSYGSDGTPGGRGLDYDLSSDDLPGKHSPTARWRLPEGSVPTFRQFLTGQGGSHYHGSSTMMIWTSVLAGALASVVCWRTMGATPPVRRSLPARVIGLAVTLAGTLFVASIITLLEAPTGH